MKLTKAKYSSTNIKKKLVNLKKQGVDVYFSATFIKGTKKSEGVLRQPLANFKILSSSVRVDAPDIVRVKVFDGEHSQKYIWVNDYVVDYEESDRDVVEMTDTQSFQGFGEAEISKLVDLRFQEQKRAEEFERLQKEVQELSEELTEQRDAVELLESENESLKQELERKKEIRYYAGMLGDILEGIGISKDKIRNPLASLMGVTDEEHATKEIHADSSGIVEETDKSVSPEEQKRNEIVLLMTEYLKTRDNQTLSNVFSIFSEIEQNPNIAYDILTFIQSHKS